MSKKIAFALLFVVIQNVCFATMFLPLPFDKQVEEATSAVEVKLENTKVFKNASGLIMTEYSFEVLESYNFSDDDLDNQKLKLSMPGGTYDGITSMIDGAPQFNKNERSFLLLKKIDSKNYLSNFSLGKFKIQEFEGKPYYVSEVFPMDPKIGRISKEKMIELMKSKWKITLMIPKIIPHVTASTSASSPGPGTEIRPIIKSVDDLEREPAQEESITNEGVPIFFWSAIAFFVFFFSFIFFKLGKTDSKHKSE
ncbi:MAG: hypothetical protein PHY93_18125 [Bacteriovorax sp.]|nr:hypothetical protein [Bacteriovorax sp.]